MDDVLKIAKNCRHYEMCKIDFLGSGVCASGLEKHYVSYYLQGRMDLNAALAERKLSVTERCVDIAASCDLCGKWDYQCYFVAELRPSLVMEALKNLVAAHVQGGGVVKRAPEDLLLLDIRKIVGEEWATNDRAVAVNIIYLPLEQDLICEISEGFKRIADRHGIANDLGFITPLDGGKLCILEYDYFFDQTDAEEISRAQRAVMDAGGLIMEYSAKLGTIRWIRHVVNQGFSRMENLLNTGGPPVKEPAGDGHKA